jgi:hypothetical protein
MVDLLDNSQDLIRLFSGCGKQFHEIAMRENGRGRKEKRKNGGLSTADQMKDRQKRLKQKLSQIKSPTFS